MPTYTLQGPDGKTYDIEGPEGATADQLGAFIQSQQKNSLAAPINQSVRPSAQSAPSRSLSTRAGRIQAVTDSLRSPFDNSTPEQGTAALGAGLGQGFGSSVLGLQQLLGHGLSAVGADTAGNWLSNDAAQGLKNLKAQATPIDNAAPFAGGMGNLAGSVAPLMAAGGLLGVGKLGATVGDAVKAIPKVGGLLAPTANMATQGALYGAAQPVSDGDYWRGVANNATLGAYLGGGTAGLLGGATGLVKGAGNVLAPVINPQKYVGQGLAAKLGPDAADVLKNIQSTQSFVPGSLPTTAQAGAHPVLVATEKALGNSGGNFKIDQTLRESANNAARWDALMGVAKTPDELNAAVQARAQAVEPLYDAAFSQSANVGRGFINFAQRPAIQKAMQQADILAKNEGQAIQWPTPDNPAISGQALDYTKRALDDMISSAKSSGNKQDVRALTQSRNYLTSWTNQYIPGMKDATSAYAQMSVPVSTMEAGQAIANNLGNKAMNSTGAPAVTLTAYKSALDRAIKNAPFGIDPQAHKVLQGIGQDLQRGSISGSLRSPGSDTAYNIGAQGWLAKSLFGPSFGGATGLGRTIGALGLTATGHPYAGLGLLGAGSKLGQWTGARLNSALGGLLLNPEMLSPYLQRQIVGSRPRPVAQAIARGLQRNLPPAVAITGTGLID